MGDKITWVKFHGQRVDALLYADLQRLYQIAYGRTDVRLSEKKAEQIATEAAISALGTITKEIHFYEKKEISNG